MNTAMNHINPISGCYHTKSVRTFFGLLPHRLINIRWMNEEHEYGYESYQSDKWMLSYKVSPDILRFPPTFMSDYSLDDVEHRCLVGSGVLVTVVPDFVLHDIWTPEHQPYLHSLRKDWIHALLLMGMRARKLRRIVIGGTPENSLGHALEDALIGKSTSRSKTWRRLARIGTDSVLFKDPVPIRANPRYLFFVIFLDIYIMGSPMHVKGTCRSLNFIGVLTELYWRHKIWIH
jgi:hypothetical protein